MRPVGNTAEKHTTPVPHPNPPSELIEPPLKFASIFRRPSLPNSRDSVVQFGIGAVLLKILLTPLFYGISAYSECMGNQ